MWTVDRDDLDGATALDENLVRHAASSSRVDPLLMKSIL
jgi:hypothetical protein